MDFFEKDVSAKCVTVSHNLLDLQHSATESPQGCVVSPVLYIL